MSKWVVKKKTFYTDRPTWLAFNAYGHEFRHFPTWHEALNYADEMTRTVVVTLPRLTALPTDRHTVHRSGLIVEYVRSRSQPQLEPGYLVVEPWERRPLALALLALAEQENDKENMK